MKQLSLLALVFAVGCEGAASPASRPVTAGPKSASTKTASASQPTKKVGGRTLTPPTQVALDNGGKKEHLGDVEGARGDYATALQAEPSSVDLIAANARMLAATDKADEAEKTLVAARKDHADEPVLWLASAGIARSQKKYDLALSDARHVLLRDQANAQALGMIALVYVDQGKYELAEVYCNNGLKLAPNSPELLTTLGFISYKRGETSRALALLERATAASAGQGAGGQQDAAVAHADIGFIALSHRDYALAKTELGKAAELGRGTKNVLAGRCYALEGERNGKEAIPCFTDLIAHLPAGAPDIASFYFTLGQLQQANKDATGALASFKKYVELKGTAVSKNDKVYDLIKNIEANKAAADPTAAPTSPEKKADPAAPAAASVEVKPAQKKTVTATR